LGKIKILRIYSNDKLWVIRIFNNDKDKYCK